MKFESVYIAGHRGLVGSALLRDLQKHGYRNIFVRTRDELDLRNTEKVREFFAANRPDAIVVAAARVGGIMANNDLPVEFLLENLQIQNNLISASFDFGAETIKRLEVRSGQSRTCGAETAAPRQVQNAIWLPSASSKT